MDIVHDLLKKEAKRQRETLMLIPSENYSSKAVRSALGSAASHKYSEGYPEKRYYQGNEFMDKIENIAIKRAKRLFGVPHANVQPYSGSPANSAVYMGLLEPKDSILGMSLPAGGHLTHGHPKITFSGKYLKTFQYGVGSNGFIDYTEIEKKAIRHKPKLIVAGTTAYSRIINWKEFARIADKVGAILMSDISHIAGLVVAGAHPSPVRHAHVVTTTTHKTLRGPRGAIIMVTNKGVKRDAEMVNKIDRAVFPGMQGGPHNNQTAAIAIALAEAGSEKFKKYGKQIVTNAKALSSELSKYRFNIISGGTDNHLMLVDLRSKKVLGKTFAATLEKAGIVTNYNSIPNDPNPPFNPSGIRMGTPAVTTRGMEPTQMKLIASWINEISINKKAVLQVNRKVKQMSKKFPISI